MPTRSQHSSGELAMLLDIFDEAYERKAWHGPNLKGSIRGLSPQIAVWRPAPARHNIWEHVLHAAYWKYVVRRRLLGEKRGSFPLKGSKRLSGNGDRHPTSCADTNAYPQNPGASPRFRIASYWFARSDADDAASWRADVSLLDQMHRSLREAIAALDPRELPIRPAGSKVSNAAILRGIAAHDVYHAGQIQLLKRLATG